MQGPLMVRHQIYFIKVVGIHQQRLVNPCARDIRTQARTHAHTHARTHAQRIHTHGGKERGKEKGGAKGEKTRQGWVTFNCG